MEIAVKRDQCGWRLLWVPGAMLWVPLGKGSQEGRGSLSPAALKIACPTAPP